MIHNQISRLILFIACFGTLACSNNPDVKQGINQRPNIVFILADDQRNDVLSCAGHPIVQTPTLDELASKGVRFTNTFVTTSICAASRASIFSGLYENSHNFTFGKPPMKEQIAKLCYPALLKKAGYVTGFVGKFGIKTENQESILDEWFDYYKLSPINSPYVEIAEDGTRKHSAEIKGEQALEFIRQQSNDKPFCLSLSFNAVHAVDANKTPGNDGHYPYPDAVASLYEDISMPEPDLNDPAIYEAHPEFLKKSLNRERYFWRWDTPEKYQINLKAYYRMLSGYDRVVKGILDELKTQGLEKNTIIIFLADNGYYMGNRGFAGKWSHYEESLRVPLIIYDPRTDTPKEKQLCDKMALNIDIPATMLDYAGVQVPEEYQGSSLLPVLTGEIVAWRDHMFIEHRMDYEKIPKFYGVRNEHYVYANYYEQDPPYEYLHDLERDPDQLINFVDDPEYQEKLDQIRKLSVEMDKHLRE